ncbi:hypothetical protein AB4156_07100 [Cupriavidus sp. 2MCAB6]|uniref:hypothetical protein n=1 Tax=Cupriavidus sp. 2MCAB6 TaxID=3232981 RepID=UPI003F8E2538
MATKDVLTEAMAKAFEWMRQAMPLLDGLNFESTQRRRVAIAFQHHTWSRIGTRQFRWTTSHVGRRCPPHIFVAGSVKYTDCRLIAISWSCE